MTDGNYPYKITAWGGRTTTVFEDRVEISNLAGTWIAKRADYDRRRWVFSRNGSYWRLMRGTTGFQWGFNLPGYVGKDRLAGWISDLPDADRLAAEAMAKLIRQSDLFGLDAQERENGIARWRLIAWEMAIVSGLLCASALIWHWVVGPMQPQLWLAAALVPGVIGLVGLLSGGRLWVTRQDDAVGSVMNFTLVMCVLALDLLLAAVQYQPGDQPLTIGAALVLAGGVGGLLVALRMPFARERGGALAWGAALGAAYGLALLGPLDTAADLAPARVGRFLPLAVHVEHHSRGGDSYSAELADTRDDSRIEVRLSRRQAEAIGDDSPPLMVLFHPGLLGAPWLEVITRATPPQALAWAWLAKPPKSIEGWDTAVPTSGPPDPSAKAGWLEKPTAAMMANVYPARASKAGIGGEATLQCGVTIEGRLSDCRIVAETPRGEGFGTAALSLSKYFRMQPKMSDGRRIAGTATIPFRFTPPTEP